MELQGERLIPADVQSTWSALNDPATLKACITGCETLEPAGDNRFRVVIAVKVGPVSARFNGNLTLGDVDPPRGYTLQFEGQGGAAGFGKGSAKVVLEPDGQNTRLRYTAAGQVGGKLAQIGSRLVDAAAAKMANDFFVAFEAHVRSAAAGVAPDEAAPVAPPAPAAHPARSAGNGRIIRWVVVALIAAVAIYFILR